jgi:Spy/CpxP family protein refolding chaperone
MSRERTDVMKTLGKPLLVLLAIGIFSIAAMQGTAQEKQKKNAKKGAKGPDPVAKMLEGVRDLSADQQAKIAEIKKQYAPKLAEIQKRRSEIMTPDRRRTEKEARKTAKDAGKKGKELQNAVNDALGLSAAEREKLEAVQQENQALTAKIREEISAVLTPDQREKLPKTAKKRKAK